MMQFLKQDKGSILVLTLISVLLLLIVATISLENKIQYANNQVIYINYENTYRDSISGVNGQIYKFSGTETITGTDGSGSDYQVGIKTTFSGISTNPTGTKIVDLGVEFKNGVAQSEINKQSGDIIYLDNRQLITRDSRQKEDIKVILEF